MVRFYYGSLMYVNLTKELYKTNTYRESDAGDRQNDSREGTWATGEGEVQRRDWAYRLDSSSTVSGHSKC